jgi:hypothetical protein
MRHSSISITGVLGLSLVVSSAIVAASCQRTAAPAAPASSAQQFDPHDLSGIWARFGTREGRASNQGGAPFPEAGDTGFGTDVPPLTPEGQKMFDAIKPGNGRALGSADAAAHPGEPIGRRRAVIAKYQNDPTGMCAPSGLTRIILSTYFAPLEIIQAKDRVIQHFEWTTDQRTIYTDGRGLPAEASLPMWNGFSIGRWEGDTFIANSNGFHENTWVDQFGYPHSDQMTLEERYRRISPDRLQLNWTLTDPKVYTKPWVGQTKTFRRLSKEESTIEEGWFGLLDNRCVPEEEFAFNEKIRDPAGGRNAAR